MLTHPRSDPAYNPSLMTPPKNKNISFFTHPLFGVHSAKEPSLQKKIPFFLSFQMLAVLFELFSLLQ